MDCNRCQASGVVQAVEGHNEYGLMRCGDCDGLGSHCDDCGEPMRAVRGGGGPVDLCTTCVLGACCDECGAQVDALRDRTLTPGVYCCRSCATYWRNVDDAIDAKRCGD